MRKHLISILGTNNYSDVVYQCGEKSFKTAYIQQALLELKFGECEKGDRISIFVTEESKKRNWFNREYSNYEKEKAEEKGQILEDEHIGLQETLKDKYGEFINNIENTTIPIGANEEELWQIFQTVFDNIGEGEELYIDITHALRNIPIQMLAVISYARVVKNVKVKGIYYGAFEVGKKNDEGVKEAPIMDLITFLDIIDWSQAASSFVNYGSSDEIVGLYKKQESKSEIKSMELGKVIKEIHNITNALETSRGYYKEDKLYNKNGMSILGSYKQFKVEKQNLEDKKDKDKPIIEPLNKLFDVIDKKLEVFDVDNNFKLGMATIQWAIDNKRTQQGFTALEETVKTFLCNHYELEETKEITRDKICKSICSELSIQKKNKKEKILTDDIRDLAKNEWIEENEGLLKKLGEKADKKILEDKINSMFKEIPNELVDLCSEISSCRNSMNHFGYSNQL